MARPRDVVSGDLFTTIPKPVAADPGAMDFRPRVVAIVSEMIDCARAHDPLLDRFEIAARVSRLAGKEVSKNMLDGYTAKSRKAFNAPAWLMPALEHTCNSNLYSSWLAEVRGGRLVLGAAAIDAEIGRMQDQIESDRERLKGLRELRRRSR